nr:hypothetical protein CPGR_05661 [Mycolicibacterium fortuitum subsp. fortuitum DSM 46621 = ATCC 6841 = JCM 6387]CRL82426.1 hypothetical protein CPGR_05648 [Mycolicibacter nonchromogenicus]
MPEAAIDEHSDTSTRKDDVCAATESGLRRDRHPVTKTEAVKASANFEFGLGVS